MSEPKISNKQRIMLEGGGFLRKIGENVHGVEGGDWFRGENLNFFPQGINLAEENAVYDYFLKGYVPSEPFIRKSDYVTAFGSCFAQGVREYLLNNGYMAYNPVGKRWVPIVSIAEGINTTFTLLQQFDWAWGNKSISEGLWIAKDKVKFSPTEEARQVTKEIFDNTTVFILTLGLSEIWYDKVTNEVFWRGIPKDQYDPERHAFRVSTVDENLENLEKIYAYIRSRRPDAQIIVTLSPIPLIATFREVPCTAASMISKSILRVAVDIFQQKHKEDPKFWYWPSYELVKELWNSYDDDKRHVTQATTNKVMAQFDRYFLVK